MECPMKTELVEFQPDSVFPLPQQMSYRHVDGRNLFIASRVPSWIVVDDAEAEVLQRISSGATIGESLLAFASHGLSSQDAEKRMQKLLQLLVGFFFFKSAEPDPDARKYRRVQMHITNSCNLRCSHCYVASGLPLPDEMGLDHWKEVIDEIKKRHEFVHVGVSGGEPLMVRWLPHLLSYAKERGCETAVITNGMLWTDAHARELAPFLDRVAVSLDGASAAVHDSIRGAGSFEKMMKGLTIITGAGLKVVLNVTMMQRNKDDLLRNLHLLLKSLGTTADIDVANFFPEGRGAEEPDQALPPAEFREALSKLVSPFLGEAWRPLSAPRRANCGYGTTFTVYANGDVSPCLSPRFIRGNVRRDGVANLLDAMAAEEVDSAVDRLPLCRTCDVRHLCGGKCHLNHFPLTKKMRQNDCSYDYRTAYYRNLVARFDAINRSYRSIYIKRKEAADDVSHA
jgi:radical SAM protein with 4Fe4S-binding SPASM domain